MRHLQSLVWLGLFAVLGMGLGLRLHSASARADAPPDYHLYLPTIIRQGSLAARFDPVSHLGGNSRSLALQGTTLYAGVGPELQVLDVSNPARFQGKGAVLLDGLARDIVLSGHYAYVAVDYAGVQVVDISNVTSPTVVSTIPLPGRTMKLTLAGNALYVAAGYQGLYVVDVANPLALRVTASLAVENRATDVAVVGNRLYVARDYGETVVVFDISAPLAPSESGTIPQTGYSLAAAGPNLLAVAGDQTLLLDVTTATPSVIFTSNYDYRTFSYSVRSADPTHLLILEGDNDDDGWAALYDITDPAHPTVVRSQAGLYGPFAATVGHGYVYAAGFLGADGDYGIVPLTITATRLQPFATVAAAPGGRLLRVSGDHAYTLSATGIQTRTLRIFDLASATGPTVVSSLDLTGESADAALDGQRLYIAGGDAGVPIVDVSNASAPRVLGVYRPGGYTFATALVGSRLAVGDEVHNGTVVTDTLRLLDVSNPAAPHEIGRYVAPGSFHALTVVGQTIYVMVRTSAAGQATSTLRILDASNPASLHELGSYALAGEDDGLAVAARRAYVTIRNGGEPADGLHILDVSTPAAIHAVGHDPNYAPATGQHALNVIGSYVYDTSRAQEPSGPTAAWSAIIDVSDASHPGYVGRLPLHERIDDIVISDNWAYVLTEGALTTFDISNPGLPQFIGFLETPPTFGLAIQGQRGYVASSLNGVKVLDMADPARPRIGGGIRTYYAAYATSLNGTTICTAEEFELTLHELRPDGQLVERWSYDYENTEVSSVVCDSNRAYVVLDNAISILDISQPDDPRHLASIDASVSGLAAQGSYLYAADSSRFVIYDVSEPTAPKELGHVPMLPGDYSDSVDVVGHYAYVAVGWDGLAIVDVSNPLSPTLVSQLSLPDGPQSVVVAGPDAYVTTDGPDLYRVDVSNPAAPAVVARTPVAGTSFSLTAANGYVYLSNWSGGLYTFKARSGAAEAGAARAVAVHPSASAKRGAAGAAGRPQTPARLEAPLLDHSRRLPH